MTKRGRPRESNYPLDEFFLITLEQHPDQIIVFRWNHTRLIKYVHVSATENQVHDYVSQYNYIMQVSSFFLVVKEKEGRQRKGEDKKRRDCTTTCHWPVPQQPTVVLRNS